MKQHWFKIEAKLPEPNILVWVRRKPNQIEEAPVYLAKRNGQELSTNPDPSTNPHWSGLHVSELAQPSDTNDGVYFPYSFSDVTVNEWCYVVPPLEMEATNG